MAIFDAIRKALSPSPALPDVSLGKDFMGQDVVGESKYQPALEHAFRHGKRDGNKALVVATLVLEPENKADANAVRVDVGGRPVGYLPRDDALTFRRYMEHLGHPGSNATCQAKIWKGDGGYGVWLDLELNRWATAQERAAERKKARKQPT
jgi:hypothetical protein